MPTIKRFARCRIEMYFADHGDPHFHIITRDDRRVSILIADLSIMAGHAKVKDIAEALAWAKDNGSELTSLWAKIYGGRMSLETKAARIRSVKHAGDFEDSAALDRRRQR